MPKRCADCACVLPVDDIYIIEAHVSAPQLLNKRIGIKPDCFLTPAWVAKATRSELDLVKLCLLSHLGVADWRSIRSANACVLCVL